MPIKLSASPADIQRLAAPRGAYRRGPQAVLGLTMRNRSLKQAGAFSRAAKKAA